MHSKQLIINIKQLLENYIEHQKDVLLRKTKFDIEKVQAKIHILEGLLIALEDIDNIILEYFRTEPEIPPTVECGINNALYINKNSKVNTLNIYTQKS